MPAPVGTPSPYLVHCTLDEQRGACGQSTYLTEEEYNLQLSNPENGWVCPNCKCYPCSFDEGNLTIMTTPQQQEG